MEFEISRNTWNGVELNLVKFSITFIEPIHNKKSSQGNLCSETE